MKKIATIILNRNLPKVTDLLYEHILRYDGELADIYVIEAGSDVDKLSQYMSWHANSKEVVKNGLRYGRGMNFGLSALVKDNKFDKYDAFFFFFYD